MYLKLNIADLLLVPDIDLEFDALSEICSAAGHKQDDLFRKTRKRAARNDAIKQAVLAEAFVQIRNGLYKVQSEQRAKAAVPVAVKTKVKPKAKAKANANARRPATKRKAK